MRGEWIRKPEGGTSVVFVHGILSSGEACWRHDSGCCWPGLLRDEPTLGLLGIYVFTYQTSIFSGSYCLSDIVDALKEHMRLDGVLESERLIFVCHSMGGIVVRKLIVERATDLIQADKNIGLFLVASPSLGSIYADWLSPLSQLFGHAQADVLRFVRDNDWLKDLDKEFFNLKESGKLRIKGKELVEDKFVVLKKLWRLQVVEPFSGARYFGEPLKVPGSDHFSIAKPKDKHQVQHRLLCQFIKEMDNACSQQSLSDRKRRIILMIEAAEQESLKQLQHFSREISTTLAPLENHAKLIAENPLVLQFLRNSRSKSTQLRVHQVLLDHADIGPYATTFVLNCAGICLENSRHVLSVGNDYSFRPYFKEALQNRVGRFPAIGVTSGVLGHHVAYPVRHDGKVIGVVCVEVDMQHISNQSKAFVSTETGGGEDRHWIRVLTDGNGVIMLSTEESWIWRTVEVVPEKALKEIRQTKQYPGCDLAQIERFESPDTRLLYAALPNLIVRGLHWKTSSGKIQRCIFLIREKEIIGGWKSMIFWRLTIPS